MGLIAGAPTFIRHRHPSRVELARTCRSLFFALARGFSILYVVIELSERLQDVSSKSLTAGAIVLGLNARSQQTSSWFAAGV